MRESLITGGTNTMKDFFYSNCYFQALKAKKAGGDNIKIIKLPSYINQSFFPHYFWKDLTTNKYYDFVKENPENKCTLWFKGYIRETSEGAWKRLARIYKNWVIEEFTKAMEVMPSDKWYTCRDYPYIELDKCKTNKLLVYKGSNKIEIVDLKDLDVIYHYEDNAAVIRNFANDKTFIAWNYFNDEIPEK